MQSDTRVMPMPRRKRCACGAKIEDHEAECETCQVLICLCGRKYPRRKGPGRQPSRCPKCESLRPDLRICGCGVLLKSSQRKTCSPDCRRIWRRIRRGATPPDGWHTQIVTALELDSKHRKVARYVAGWLQRRGRKKVGVIDTAVVYLNEKLRFECRHSPLSFRTAKDLPPWVYMDDRTRLTSLQGLAPPATGWLAGYIVSSDDYCTVAATSADFGDVAQWKSRAAWIPRRADIGEEMYCKRDRFQVDSLLEATTSA